jgi:hypothetical protein
MRRLYFPNKITTSEIEKLFSISDIPKFEDSDFVFPSTVSHRGFGIFPSIIIFFFIWLRNNKKGDLVIDIEPDDEKGIADFSYSYLGYTILSAAWKHKEVTNMNGLSLKNYFKPHTRIFHERIDFLNKLPNDSIFVPLFDHYSKQQGLSHWFYKSDYSFIGSPTELSNTVYRIFEELGKIYKTKLSKNVNVIIEDLEIIIWELVKNTHDHATKDYLNQIDLSPNTRGVYLKIHRSSKKNFISNEKDNVGLKNYFDNVLAEGDNFLLEISVFDVGPGMIKRFLGKDWNESISANAEVDIIKKCLCKGISSTEGFRGNNRGYGLNNALMTLSNRKGYIKIRTGKVSIYRDLLKSPHFETMDYTRIELQDSKTNSPSEFSPAGDTIGTLITMLYPLK